MDLFKSGTRRMLRDIESELRFTRGLIGKDALDARVMAAMARVPRERFVPGNMRPLAFRNGPLPIGHGQTISQPFIVALMTDLVLPAQGGAVLEVGTGCGYQTAVLAELVGHVYSLEIIPELARGASRRLERMGYGNVSVQVGDGHLGWREHAPYDGIILESSVGRFERYTASWVTNGNALCSVSLIG
jgi:protein-L-isoaspartate(D-aspartate) O-methyltransferase